MANWKLTPVHIDGNMFGITPEWTSGSGCYRVKRFSSVFPFLINGEKLNGAAIQLLRWSSKLPADEDMSVYIRDNNKIIHLFSAHSFVVEFFRRNWAGTDISKNFIYLNPHLVGKFSLGTAECGIANCLSVLGAFKDASSKIKKKLADRNAEYALSILELCSSNRDRIKKVVAPEPLISRSIDFHVSMKTVVKANPIDHSRLAKTVQSDEKTLSATQISLSSAKPRQAARSINPNRDSAENYIPKERSPKPEELVVFKTGTLLFSKEVDMATYSVFEYGAFHLLSITANGEQSLVPTKTLVEAKSLIRLAIAHQEAIDKNYLCLKFTLGGEDFGIAVAGRFASPVIDCINDIWGGTQIGYNIFVSLAPIEYPHPAKRAIEVLCKQAHCTKIQPSHST